MTFVSAYLKPELEWIGLVTHQEVRPWAVTYFPSTTLPFSSAQGHQLLAYNLHLSSPICAETRNCCLLAHRWTWPVIKVSNHLHQHVWQSGWVDFQRRISVSPEWEWIERISETILFPSPRRFCFHLRTFYFCGLWFVCFSLSLTLRNTAFFYIVT